VSAICGEIVASEDKELLSQYLETRDPLAFTEITRRYRSLVFSAARRVTGNHHDAEDVAQACFVELAERADQIKGPLGGWLHLRATSRAVNTLRKRSRRRATESKAAAPEEAPIVEATWDLVGPLIDEEIERLPDTLRLPLILHFLQDFSQEEVGRILKMSRQTVARRVRLGIERIRKQVAKKHIVAATGVLTVLMREHVIEAAPSSLRISLAKIGMAGLGPSRRPITRLARLKLTISQPLTVLGIFQLGWLKVLALLFLAFVATVISRHFFIDSGPPVYDQLEQIYDPYLTANLSTGFAWHAAAMQKSPEAFWRGSQPLFFSWCKANCADWLGNTETWALCDADPGLNGMERISFVTDADNSAPLPIQIELLQGLITVRLVAEHGYGYQDTASVPKMAAVLCDAYRAALLQDDPSETKPPISADEADVKRLVDELSADFKPMARGRHHRVVDLLRPSPLTTNQAAELIQVAERNNPALEIYLGTPPDSMPVVRAVRQRYRVNSVATTGQASFLVLLAGGNGKPCLVEVKQQVPSSAELAGVTPPDARTPGCRVAEDAQYLSGGRCLPISWCELASESFTVRPYQPSPGLSDPGGESWQNGIVAARAWGIAAAGTHDKDSRRMQFGALVTPALESMLIERSNQYIAVMEQELDALRADPRAVRDVAAQRAMLDSWLVEKPDRSDAETPED
jgi:RNA polymerase sigma factor (sigma-70 family)